MTHSLNSTRLNEMFLRSRREQRGVFVPFLMLGDPTPALSLEIIDTLITAGADALELGVPFSDPIADGPTIQAAANRALDAGVTPQKCFDLLKNVRTRYPQLPIGLLVYGNLVVAGGAAQFYRAMADAGVDSVLIADVPVFEIAPFVKLANRERVAQVLIVPPHPTISILRDIAGWGQGYTYVVARSGVTGASVRQSPLDKKVLAALRCLGAPPSLVGFGISTPDHVKAALQAGADGAISGSAVVDRFVPYLADPPQIKQALTSFISSMLAATSMR